MTVNHAADDSEAGGASAITAAIGLTLAGAVAVTSLDRGGFTASGQNLLLVFSAVVLVEIVLFAPRALSASLRLPLAAGLLLLGVLATLSATWTIGPAAVSARWGLVILAYGGLAVSGYVLAWRAGLWPVAIGIASLAVLEAILGLGAAALHQRPWAELIGGSWRPGGTFEYAAALGLLEICALPAAIAAASSASRRVRYPGALALVLAGATLGCADSRTDLGLAALTLVFLAGFGPQRLSSRRDVLAATGLLTLATIAGALLLGRHTSAGASGGGAGPLAGLAIACLALVMAWPALRALAGRLEVRRMAALVLVAIVAGGTVWLAIGYASTLVSTGNGIDHGRISYWIAAARAWQHHPLLGSGAGTYAAASLRYQAGNDHTQFAHNLPLELATELGLVGFLAGVLVYADATRLLVRTLRAPEAWLVAPMVGCFLLANLIDWPWHLAGLGALWAAASGSLGAVAQGSGRPAM